MEDNNILEPLKSYAGLKEANKLNAKEAFDDLLKKSGANEVENQATCKKYYAKCSELEAETKEAGGKKFLKGFLIFLTVVLFLLALAGFYLGLQEVTSIPWLVTAACSVVAAILLIVLIVKKINPMVKAQEAFLVKLKEEKEALLAEALGQTSALNSLFDWSMQVNIIKKTAPLIQLDVNFDEAKYMFLKNKYGFEDNTDPKVSTYYVQSGSIVGNPFLIQRTYNQIDAKKTYTGTLLITWVTRESDGNGHTRSVTHSQTLVATVEKFCPEYRFETCLIYSNEAAPDLNFSRVPQIKANDDEKDIERFIRKETKEMEKLGEQAVKKGGKVIFTPMGNNEFDTLFHAWDRDNSVQFRLLFTPLAQNNEEALIRNRAPYGDDFCFFKRKCINVIRSEHAQNQDLYANPESFTGFDINSMRNHFVDYMDTYFTSLYFDLAPLLSIPLYQQDKTEEYIYNKGYPSNVNPYEHEALANAFDVGLLAPSNAATSSIMKTDIVSKQGENDKVSITAHAFKGVRKVDYVSRMGGDGFVHAVPVEWIEYTPVERTSYMEVKNYDTTREAMNGKKKDSFFSQFLSRYASSSANVYQRKLFAFLLGDESFGSDSDIKTLDQAVPNKESVGKKVSDKIKDSIEDLKKKDSEEIKEEVKKVLSEKSNGNK